ncbi:VanZ family protein [Salinibacterium soli]|uniref:VanZ family protein n=1 Tax=Antiquaquibacter soli TaxID=3064523 RepID=A0ABT9BN18_9MICO|nr:VanZ family protein [Protaetiibacter sp. WY-16]MDO7882395.1 VanZ family protein [Protaetiibacter sp. WY-16]
MFRRRHFLSVVAALYFGMLVALTFTPGSAAARESWALPLVLFIPVGLLLTLLMGRRRWWVAVGFGMLGAAWVEAAQTIWMPPGYASALDILCSSAGAVFGVLLGVVLLTVRQKSMHSHELPRIVTHPGK